MFEVQEISRSQKGIIEQLGSKEKFWIDGDRWMYKVSRPGSGEHWAEKLGESVCRVLGVPCANYELARHEGQIGVISENIVPPGASLLLGNTAIQFLGNPRGAQRKFGSKLSSKLDIPRRGGAERKMPEWQHTVATVFASIGPPVQTPLGFDCPDGISNARDVFTGYLMLDCLIANQDRHELNWALVLTEDPGGLHLAPTFDHGAGFARQITDAERESRLRTRDRGWEVEQFAKRAKSGFCSKDNPHRALSSIDAFVEAMRACPSAAKFWLERLSSVDEIALMSGLDQMPEFTMSDVAKEFTRALVCSNRRRLLAL
ncbi:MAG: hypothetical protein ACKVQU_29570 [Burkholderiales bacterium]